jgi:hypothetical protein
MKRTKAEILTQLSFPGMALIFCVALRHLITVAGRLFLFPLRENSEVKG